jgi:dipeptidyl aminopeptidase/acylaminoacyl peptidase
MPIKDKKVPALLFIHGSGSESRFASAYFADYFARRGIAVLIYDKRGAGSSSGNWRTSSFRDLANDAIAGIKLLEANEKIDATKIGVYGHSQGGSICPMLLTMYPRLSFGISSGSAGVSMEESDWYEVQNRFKNYLSGRDYENAMTVMRPYIKFASTGKGYEELVTQAKKYEQQQWFKDYVGNIDSTAFFFRYYRNVGRYNAVDYWKKVKQPVLILKGDKDLVSPGYPSFQNIENALREASNKNFKIVLLPNSSHEMHIPGKRGDFWFKATPGYPGIIYNWLKKTIIEK